MYLSFLLGGEQSVRRKIRRFSCVAIDFKGLTPVTVDADLCYA
jgi:hypothetical protein